MNKQLITIYSDLAPDVALAVELEMVADYLTFLYRIARTGGHTNEEEIFVENLAAAMEIEPEVLAGAVRQSQSSSEGIGGVAERLRATPLRESAYLDACHLSRIDREVTAEEKYALREAEAGLDLTADFVKEAQELARRQGRLLHAFCRLAVDPDPADLWATYLHAGLRQSDRQRRLILADPVKGSGLSERVAVLSLILKLAGVGWQQSVKRSVIHNLGGYLQLDAQQRAQAMADAWDMEASLQSLAERIQTQGLRLIALGDAHRICLSDAEFCALEQELLRDLALSFGFDAKDAAELLERSYDEVAFRRSVTQLIRNPARRIE